MGLPATGRTIAVPAIAILRVVDGKVTELHAVFDQAGMMRQLGV
jgi:predicted ester cyclase